MRLSQTLHPISICVFENIHDKFLHISFMLPFTESQLRPDTTVMNSFGVSFSWPLFSKHTVALSLSVALVTLPPALHWRCNCNFFQQGFLNLHDTKQSFEQCQFNDDNSERKNMQLLRLLSGEKDVLGHLLGRLGGKKEANKMVFKIHVVRLHTHEKPEVIGNPHGWVVVLHYALSYSALGKTWVDRFHMEIRWLCKVIVKDKMHITKGEWKTHESVQLFKSPML